MSVRMIKWSGRQAGWEDYVQLGGAKSHSDYDTFPGGAVCGFQINLNGVMYGQDGGSFTINDGTWLLYGVNSDYEVRASLNSGTTPTGSAMGSWLLCSTTRTWQLSQSGIGSKTCNFTLEIRLVSTQLVIDSTTVTLLVEVDPSG